MAFDVVIDVIEKAPVKIDDDVAQTLTDVHAALVGLPGDRAANIDFPTTEAARAFMTQAKAWCEKEGKRFTRVGDIKGKPLRVSFRVVTKRATDTADPTDTPSPDGAQPATPATAASTPSGASVAA
jgi:hypothetical protein